jgi:hypothetical protein
MFECCDLFLLLGLEFLLYTFKHFSLMNVTAHSVEAAAQRLAGRIHRTPLLESIALNNFLVRQSTVLQHTMPSATHHGYNAKCLSNRCSVLSLFEHMHP